MITAFEDFALQKGWHFEYGRTDYQNLYQGEAAPEYCLFLDPLQKHFSFSEFGNIEKELIAGQFLLLKASQLDEVYHTQLEGNPAQGKYEKYIKPCYHLLREMVSTFACEGWVIEKWHTIEVINYFSENMDGLLVSFEIRQK